MSRSWDAGTYDRVSTPQLQWASVVLERLSLRGDELVLDAGCGSGRVTRLLLERLPSGHVIAVDSSAEMVEHAREAFAGDERVTVFRADLAELELEEPVDAVFSNAVFHWIPDHDALFEHLHAALRPGGVLVAQCGGEGNVARFHAAAREVASGEPYAEHLANWTGPWNFASADETAERLERAGFTKIDTWLEPSPVTPDDPLTFVKTVCLGPHLQRLPEELREDFAQAVCDRAGPRLDYVRLNIDAKKPS
jgi:trans-aconitate 2-methyltransferase